MSDPQPPSQPAGEADDVDASIENELDVNMSGTQADTANAPQQPSSSSIGGAPPLPDLGIEVPAGPPAKKESSLREFLSKMDDYAPIIPDAVTAHYLTLSGLPPPGSGPNATPPHLARLLALATQKFVADIAADAYQYSRIRSSNSQSANNPMGSLGTAAAGMPGQPQASTQEKGKGAAAATHLGVQRSGFGGGGQGGTGQGRTVLTMEDLGMAVGEYGVSVRRGEFYR